MPGNKTPDASSQYLRQENGRVIRAISLSVAPVAASFAADAHQVVLAAALLAAEAAFTLSVFVIVVYGSRQHAERVFRLLRWLRGCPEPPAPTTPKE
jgi:hypothetical protein